MSSAREATSGSVLDGVYDADAVSCLEYVQRGVRNAWSCADDAGVGEGVLGGGATPALSADAAAARPAKSASSSSSSSAASLAVPLLSDVQRGEAAES